MRYIIAIVGIFIALLSGCAVYAQGKPKPASAEEIINLVNEYRKSKGLKPLKMNESINKVAAMHSHNMARGNVSFGHDGFDGRFAELRKPIPDANGMAENVAYNNGTAEQVVDGWLHSAPHKKNIEGNYELTGVGTAISADGKVYYTQIFIKRQGK